MEKLVIGPQADITNPIYSPSLQGLILQPINFFQKFIPSFIALALIIGVVAFLFILIIGAVQWISSGGDKANIETARGKIMNAIIGLVILFSIWALIKLIELFFNIDLLELNLGVLKII